VVRAFLRSHRRWWLLLSPLVLGWTAFVAIAFWRSTLTAPEPTLLVRDRAGRRRAHYEPATTTIAIPMQSPWALRESVVLHEVAHHLDCTASAQQAERRSWHGPSYREAMGLLVEQVLGGAAALLLRAGYDGAGVRR